VKAGYAAVGTDTGHVGGNADFVAGHPEKLVDFGYRAIEAAHLTAGIVDCTRPLCAYPTTAHFKGTGSTDDAKNFRCE
jgi:feruloyl esterase